MQKKFFALGISAFFLAAAISFPSQAKTVAQCNAEYASSKAAIRTSGEKKRDFVTRCRADTAASTAPLNAGGSTTSTATAPSTDTAPPVQAPRGRTATGTPSKANEFATEAEAKGHCPGDTVVWANTKSNIYHYSGNRNYGHTRAGAYVCERDTGALGFRAARNEKGRGGPRG